MNYNLDKDEQNVLLLLEAAKAEGSFDKNAYTYETKYSNCDIHYSINFYHRELYCQIKFSSKNGTFSFYVEECVGGLINYVIEKKYCTFKSYFFGLIKETTMDVNHPIIDASLNIHKIIMQKAEEVDKLKRQKTWDKLLSKS